MPAKIKIQDDPPPKGTLRAGTGEKFERVAVGTNGQILAANDAAPQGVSWEDPPEGGGGGMTHPQILARNLGC